MSNFDVHDTRAITDRLVFQAGEEKMRVTAHAHQEMVDDSISIDDVLNVLRRSSVIEYYAEVCDVCSDTLLAPETIRHLEVLLKQQQAPRAHAPVFSYA